MTITLSSFQKRATIIALSLFGLTGYCSIAYGVAREEFWLLLLLWVFIWSSFLIILKIRLTEKHLLTLAILYRLIFLFSFPALSDDYYRFIWDGMLNLEGISPFFATPKVLIEANNLSFDGEKALFNGLNSPVYHSIYPSLDQLFFTISALFYKWWQIPGAVISLRTLVWLGEVPVFWLLPGLLERFQLPRKNAYFYLLNPLIIVELSGNLHPEAWMMAGLCIFLWFLPLNWQKASLGLWIGLATKLLPFMLFPVLIKERGIKKAFLIGCSATALLLLSTLPYLNLQDLSNWGSSINLYFQRFEFNASLYYLVRAVGYWVKGYNLIQQVGPLFSVIAACLILFISWRNLKHPFNLLPQRLLLIWCCYLLFSTTVHPWYISTLLFFSVLANRKVGMVWSFTVFFSYAAYQYVPVEEKWGWLLAEYGCVWAILIGELFFIRYPFAESTSGNHLKE